MLVIVVPAVIVIYDELRKIGKEVISIREKKKKVVVEENKTDENKV